MQICTFHPQAFNRKSAEAPGTPSSNSCKSLLVSSLENSAWLIILWSNGVTYQRYGEISLKNLLMIDVGLYYPIYQNIPIYWAIYIYIERERFNYCSSYIYIYIHVEREREIDVCIYSFIPFGLEFSSSNWIWPSYQIHLPDGATLERLG